MNRNSCDNPTVRVTLGVIGGKWKPLILYLLEEKKFRFGELYKQMNGITQKMLTQQLRELELDGLINRKVYPQVPPKVEYSISPYGKTLKPLLESMCDWGAKHLKRKIHRK